MSYWILRFIVRLVFSFTMRVKIHGMENLPREGGYILASSHVSHLDPVCLSAMLAMKIHWMARIEFYRHRFGMMLMRLAAAFPVNRQGVPVRAIKRAIRTVAGGEVVGIFPEGELKHGTESVLRGGPIREGACLVAQHSGRPIVPCVILGTHELLRADAWMPFLRGRFWIEIGEPIPPVTGESCRKAARGMLAEELRRRLIALDREMRRRHALPDSVLP
jgi:1-acyl-sn-glycerol-3-phosphate acyltransferase